MKKIINKVYKRITKAIENTSWYNNFWGGVCKFWYFEKKYVKVINLGSNSANNAFSYKNTSVLGLNMALGPQSLEHDYSILKNYFSYLEENGVVLITLCPFSCMKVNYTQRHNLKYYTILHPATIPGFKEDERQKALYIQANPLKVMPVQCCLGVIKELVRRIMPRKKVKVDFTEHADKMLNSWKVQFSISDLDASLSSEHKKDFIDRANTLREMIDFCKIRGLRPYVVLPPVHKTLSDILSPSFMDNYVYEFVKVAGATDIFLNYFNSETFQKDEFFSNSYYLNSMGADKFTNDVIARLNIQ